MPEGLVGDKPDVLDMAAEVKRRRNFAIISHPGITAPCLCSGVSEPASLIILENAKHKHNFSTAATAHATQWALSHRGATLSTRGAVAQTNGVTP